MNRQRTGVNVVAGALVSIVAGLLPFVSFVAPLVGGGLSGYLQRAGPPEGAIAGALAGRPDGTDPFGG